MNNNEFFLTIVGYKRVKRDDTLWLRMDIQKTKRHNIS